MAWVLLTVTGVLAVAGPRAGAWRVRRLDAQVARLLASSDPNWQVLPRRKTCQYGSLDENPPSPEFVITRVGQSRAGA